MNLMYLIIGDESTGFEIMRTTDQRVVARTLTREALDAALRLLTAGE